jgi:hypothetical protein
MSEALVRRLLWEVRVLRILVIALAIGGAGFWPELRCAAPDQRLTATPTFSATASAPL